METPSKNKTEKKHQLPSADCWLDVEFKGCLRVGFCLFTMNKKGLE